jgi:mRNA interferase MazF
MNRGNVVLFDFPFSDATGSKLRPALVIQADLLNQAIDDTILALITRTRRGGPTEFLIDLSTPDGQQSGLHHTSVVDCKNLLTADQSFIHTCIGDLPDTAMRQVEKCLKMALAIP